MKAKYLFGMLLSGAMLAACTADDDLNAGKLAQKTPSAPVFTVSFDNDGELQNRATLNTTLWQLGFDKTDKMSLYHGITEANVGTLKGWQNAVYQGNGEGSDVTMTFETAAMVQPGLAVMIYPADTEFGEGKYDGNNLGTAAPVISIDKVQDEKTVEKTPYMSEILNLAIPTTGKEDNQAGYDKKYDITLKRVASTLSLALNITKKPDLPAGVAAIAINRVALTDLETDGQEEGPFTVSIPVKALVKEPAAYVNTSSKKAHTSWKHVSELDTDEAKGIPSLLTKDVKNNVATFTLLPMDELNEGQVTVQTNYGKVDLTDEDGNKLWKGAKETTPAAPGIKGVRENVETKITDGINNMTTFIWHKATKGTFCYNGEEGADRTENVGGHINCTLDVDLSTLNMDELHILNEQHLVDAIAVYNKLCPEADVTFLLDGDEDGVFEMSNDTWAVVEAQLKKEGSDLKFAPCTDKGEECEVIVLNNKESTAEVPELQFKEVEDVELELDLAGGNWTYKSKTSSDKAKNISGVAEIHVTKGVHLTPTDFVAVYGKDGEETTQLVLVIDQGAFMDVTSGRVDLQVDVVNKGTITISENTSLRAGQAKGNDVSDGSKASKTLTNWSQNQGDGVFTPKVTGLTRACGTIINKGTLGVVGKDNADLGYVNNYGVIKIEDDNASTTITNNANATDGESFAKGYNDDNLIGTIVLKKVDDAKVSVKGSTTKGFIKYTLDKDNPEYKDFGGDKCAANYIEFGKNTVNIAYNRLGKNTDDDPYTYPNIPNTIRYIEITAKKTNFSSNTAINLWGVIVNKDSKLDIVTGATMNSKAYYIASGGEIGIIGTVAGNPVLKPTYFGDTAEDDFTGKGLVQN